MDALAGHDPAGLLRGAGMMLLYRDDDGDRALFVKHRERGTWEFPGGEIEPGESAEEAAVREVAEEIGASPYGRVSLLMRDRMTGVDYSTFQARASTTFDPALSDEIEDFQWSPLSTPPQPLHPGVRMVLDRVRMNELDIARAIADGRLSSPQQYENIWLFAMRITGTGASYRPELNEHVWRDPSLYLNGDFLDRCNGLPVIWEHPPGEELDQREFERRIVGAIMLPYLVEDEVWGVAKIYDQDAAQMMLDLPLSTSPAVVFRDPGVNRTRRLEGGRTLLIEGEPSLLDHLAICELGVWDKGGQPTGIARGEPEMAEQPEAAAGKSEPTTEQRVDALHDAVGKMSKRLDAFMKRRDRRMDDDDDKRRKDDDDDRGKHARRRDDDDDDDRKDDKDFEKWAEEEKDEPEHKDAKRKDDDDDDDKKRKDAESEEGEEKGEPEPMASDDDRRKDRRKDDDDDRRKDAKKDDDDACDDDDRKDDDDKRRDDDRRRMGDDRRDRRDARADRATVRELKQQIARLERQFQRPKPMSDDELNALAERQQDWDRVAQAHGLRASRPLDGEALASYDRREAKRFQQYSPKWAKVDLATMPISVVSDVIAPEIRTDSITAAYRGDPAPSAVLREIRRPDRTGRVISEFVGPVSATLAPFRLPKARVRRINNQPSPF